MNENESPYLDDNLQQFAGAPTRSIPDDRGGFEESNLMHSINGYVYGNGPLMTANAGQRVRWYLMTLGTEVDLHTPHWHGNTVTTTGMRTDVLELLPASMMTADMVPDDPGTWLFHCHVNDHIAAGMSTATGSAEPRRMIRRLFLAALATAMTAAVSAAPASGHATLAATTPESGASLGFGARARRAAVR